MAVTGDDLSVAELVAHLSVLVQTEVGWRQFSNVGMRMDFDVKACKGQSRRRRVHRSGLDFLLSLKI